MQGDVVAIVSESGYAVVCYTYDAWGNILSITGMRADNLGILNPLRYRGYVYDHETELYYLQSRYYDPTWGRFLNADVFVSTGQGILGNNMFAYCGNNPITGYDPSGMLTTSLSSNAHLMYESFGGINPEIGSYQENYSNFASDIDRLIGDAISATNANDLIDIYKRAKQYRAVDVGLELNKIRAGWRKLKSGFTTIVVTPDPTPVDEIVGAATIIWGFYNIVIGIGELLGWTEDE